jgi:hypothetical protein
MSLIDDKLDVLNRLSNVALESSKRCKINSETSTQMVNAAKADSQAQRLKADAYQDAYYMLKEVRDNLRERINELL